jgi:hypothetical protein
MTGTEKEEMFDSFLCRLPGQSPRTLRIDPPAVELIVTLAFEDVGAPGQMHNGIGSSQSARPIGAGPEFRRASPLAGEMIRTPPARGNGLVSFVGQSRQKV